MFFNCSCSKPTRSSIGEAQTQALQNRRNSPPRSPLSVPSKALDACVGQREGLLGQQLALIRFECCQHWEVHVVMSRVVLVLVSLCFNKPAPTGLDTVSDYILSCILSKLLTWKWMTPPVWYLDFLIIQGAASCFRDYLRDCRLGFALPPDASGRSCLPPGTPERFVWYSVRRPQGGSISISFTISIFLTKGLKHSKRNWVLSYFLSFCFLSKHSKKMGLSL